MGPGGGQNGLLPEGVPVRAGEPDPERPAHHHARLLLRHADSDREGTRVRRPRPRRRAEGDDRQRGARGARVSRPGSDRPSGSRAASRGRTAGRTTRRSSASPATCGRWDRRRAGAGVLPAGEAGAEGRRGAGIARSTLSRAPTAIRPRSRSRHAPRSPASIPDLALFDAALMDERLAGTLATSRFNTLLLAMLGARGPGARGVGHLRRGRVLREPAHAGDRRSPGARRDAGRVVRLVVGQAMRPLAIGALLGVARRGCGEPHAREPAVRRQPQRSADDGARRRRAARSSAWRRALVPARRAAALDPTRALQGEVVVSR